MSDGEYMRKLWATLARQVNRDRGSLTLSHSRRSSDLDHMARSRAHSDYGRHWNTSLPALVEGLGESAASRRRGRPDVHG